jgi:hypothetical protein
VRQKLNPEKCSWWLNELGSLGINTQKKYACNNLKEASELTEDIKQIFYEEYQKAFNEK